MRGIRELFNICVLSVVGALLIVGTFNFAIEFYFRRHPSALIDAATRNNPTDRLFRENLVPADKAPEFYDLRSGEEVREMFGERFTHAERYEPYTQWRLAPFIGKYHGVSEHGYRVTRDPGPWPPDAANYNIFFFGNSTGFGVSPYWATVASHLQDAMNASARLGQKVYVYNFSRPGYITRQEQILFFLLLEQYPAPNMAIFLDGVADFCFVDGNPSNWQGIAAYYDANVGDREAAAASYGVITHWEKLREFVVSLPLTRALNALRDRMATRDSTLPASAETPVGESILRQVIDRYYGFVRQVRAVANAYKVQPLFVWQPTPLYKYDRKYHLFNPARTRLSDQQCGWLSSDERSFAKRTAGVRLHLGR